MRVLLLSNLYPPYWIGGYEQIAAWVAEGLRQRGHDVAVLTGRGPAFAGRPEVYPDLDLDLPALREAYAAGGIVFGDGLREGVRRHVFSRRNFASARRAFERFRPDLVSFWNPAFITFSPLLAARLGGIPAIVHLSDTAANPFRNPRSPGFPKAFRPAALAAVDLLLRLSRPRRVVVPSTFLRDKLAKLEGIAFDRMEVLHWPVEPSIDGAPSPERSVGPAVRLLFVGTLMPEKGPGVLIEALRGAVRERPDLTLTLVGEAPGVEVAALRDAAAGLPVRFTGRLDRAGVVEAYRSHDVLVFPSLWEEPFAVVPLEAMAMGLTVIATRAGGTPEAVEDERTGLLVPPKDADALRQAILRVAGHPGLARGLAAAGQRWARETRGFAPFMDRLERLYEDARAPERRAA